MVILEPRRSKPLWLLTSSENEGNPNMTLFDKLRFRLITGGATYLMDYTNWIDIVIVAVSFLDIFVLNDELGSRIPKRA